MKANAPLLGLAASLLALGAQAGEPDFATPLVPPRTPSPGWEFSLYPYGLLAGVDGSVEVGPLSADIDQSFGDILENLDAGLILAGEARRGRFSLLGDFIYLGLSADTSTSRPNYDRVDLELDTIIFTALANYRVVEEPQTTVDLGAGARIFHVDSSLKVSDSTDRFPDLRSGDEKTLVDAIVAVRLAHQVNSKWSIRFYGDIGSGDSDLTWQAWANIGYVLNENVTLLAGYRHLDYDLEKGAIDMDLAFSGPQIGAAISF